MNDQGMTRQEIELLQVQFASCASDRLGISRRDAIRLCDAALKQPRTQITRAQVRGALVVGFSCGSADTPTGQMFDAMTDQMMKLLEVSE